MNIPMESGPNNVDAFLHPEQMLAAAGYPIAAPLPRAIAEACSTAGAIAGVAGTAMGQLANLQNGVQNQMVFTRLR